MSFDVLTLGPFVFDGFSTPERMPFGGRQHMHVHKMPGGARAIDCMGPDDVDRAWEGTIWGQDAINDALTLDALRKAGAPLPFSNGIESQTVVILEFLPRVRKFNCVEYAISVTPLSGGGGGFGIPGLDSILGADLGAAMRLLR